MILAMAGAHGIAIVAWRWTGREVTVKFGARHFANIIPSDWSHLRTPWRWSI